MKNVLTLDSIKVLIKPSTTDAHKGTHGHALLIAGSYGMMGSAVLASQAALKSGVGLVSIQTPQCGVDILQISCPQAMVIPDQGKFHISTIELNKQFQAIGIGPGLGQHPETITAFEEFLNGVDQPIVIDADALNILALNRALIKHIPPNSLLTPHPGEFKRLIGEWSSEQEKEEKLLALCKETNIYVLLKGANSTLCTPSGNRLINSTGNEGMGKGGSGDALTGIITALIAQGYSTLDAASIGMFVHGLAGDLAANKLGKVSMNAQDIISYLPNAFIQLL